MRRFYINEKSSNSGGLGGGAFWKFLLFVAILCGFLWLLHQCPSCERTTTHGEKQPEKDVPIDTGSGYSSIIPPTPILPVNPEIPPVNPGDLIDDPEGSPGRVVSNQLIIALNISSDIDVNEEQMEEFAIKVKHIYPSDDYFFSYYNPLTGVMLLQVPATKLQQTMDELNGHDTLKEFDYLVFYDSILEGGSMPTDPMFEQQCYSWYFEHIQAYEAWDITRGSKDVVVAVVDNFIDTSHVELSANVVDSYSVCRVNNDTSPIPYDSETVGDIGHGTHVAATAVGAQNNGLGLSGIAPNCQLMAISVADDQGFMRTSSLIEGVMYAILHNADVVNISLGIEYEGTLSVDDQYDIIDNKGKMAEKAWSRIFEWAAQRDCIIVWAAGNSAIISGVDNTKRDECTIRVSALNENLQRANFSNYGDYIGDGYNCFSTVSAPGVNIWSAGPDNQFMSMKGTSMAAPIVTGAVALMKSLDRAITAERAIEILRETGKPIAGGNIGPMIQIADALRKIEDSVMDYDDVLNDPSKIEGLWRCSDELFGGGTIPVTLYFRFLSPTSGELSIVEHHANNVDKTYSADLNVKIDEQILIEQHGNAGHYIRYRFECIPDQNGKMYVEATPESASSSNETVGFNLIKEE